MRLWIKSVELALLVMVLVFSRIKLSEESKVMLEPVQ